MKISKEDNEYLENMPLYPEGSSRVNAFVRSPVNNQNTAKKDKTKLFFLGVIIHFE